ncbi:MAG: ATP-binding protein [Chitinophagaceae bacterium]|nr:ATP-binding protein [Chitinophagaceae bacterium]
MKPITTEASLESTAFAPEANDALNDIAKWIKQTNPSGLERNASELSNRGYRVLFNGPAGSGRKTTAALFGKQFQKPVYRIELSTIVSKYIGETEKNIAAVFEKAKAKDWILFFDEAEALFGKRTDVKDAHDKYANQEINYLLQKLEQHPGLTIVSSNMKSNIDEAFKRRFNTVVRFPSIELKK